MTQGETARRTGPARRNGGVETVRKSATVRACRAGRP